MTLRPCLDCGVPSPATRCEQHTTCRTHELSASERGYDTTWHRLSKRARKLQPWCSDCGATDDLTTDHTVKAWARKAAGKAIRLRDVEVVCRPCNSRRGARRVGLLPRGGAPSTDASQPLIKAKFVNENGSQQGCGR